MECRRHVHWFHRPGSIAVGFFLSKEDAAPPAKKREGTVEGFRLEHSGGCSVCPLDEQYPETLSTSKVPPFGTDSPVVYFLMTEPRNSPNMAGEELFINSKEGAVIRRGTPLEWSKSIRINGCVRCPCATERPTSAALRSCLTHWQHDVMATKPVVIVGIGPVPLSIVWPGAALQRLRGTLFPVQIGDYRCWYYPVLEYEGTAPINERLRQADMDRLWSWLDNDKLPSLPPIVYPDEGVYYPTTPEELRGYLHRMRQEYLAVDIETSGLKPYRGHHIRSIAISDGDLTVAVAALDVFKQELYEYLWSKPWVCHNSMFERMWLEHWFDKDMPFSLRDTMVWQRIWHHRESFQSLAVSTRIHLGVDVKALTGGSGGDSLRLSIEELLPYNAYDAKYTALLWRRFQSYTWTAADMDNIDRLEALARPLVRMERNGVPTDVDYARELERSLKAQRQQAVAQTCSLPEVVAWSRSAGKPFDINSSKQIGNVLSSMSNKLRRAKCYPGETPSGQVATDEESLSKIPASVTRFPEGILAYRSIDKLLSTYVAPIVSGELLALDGRIHPSYRSTKTATIRLSAEDPNIQNYPKRKHREIRGMFRAPEGYVMVAADYGQIEARVIAMASRDKNLIQFQREDYDIHSAWLQRLLFDYPQYLDRIAKEAGITDEAKAFKAARDKIKTDFVFASFFGSTASSCARRAGVPEPIMVNIVAEFWREFSGVYEWINTQRQVYADTGEIATLTGRWRTGVLLGNEPINTPIQGTARDIVSQALIALDEAGYTPTMDIHDDETFILPDDEHLETKLNEIAEIMVKPRFPWITVPLVVEMAIGQRWDKLEKLAVFKGTHFE